MNRFVRILAVLPFFVPAACTSDATDEFNIPEEYLAEAESIPPYWIASTSEVNDYILFKRTSGTDPATETGQYQMTKVRNIVNHEGFKDGYALVMVSNL